MQDLRSIASRRRTLLQRGASLALGALGLGGSAAAAGAVTAEQAHTFRLKGRRRASVAAVRGRAPAPAPAGGDLLDDEGNAIGTFHLHGLAGPSPLRGHALAPVLELQTFVLEKGTLFGIGAAPGRDGVRSCALVGGTGEFAGAQGSYVERPSVQGPGRSGVEFEFRLLA